MKKRLRKLYRPFAPPAKLTAGDNFLLRWVSVCCLALAAVVLMMVSGAMEWLELEQIRFLGNRPFYIGAEEAQETLMGPAGLFGLCVAVTFYLGAVLLRERRFSGRLQVTVLALAVLLMPGMLCVLWGGVLNMAAPVTAALVTWFGVEILHLFRKK